MTKTGQCLAVLAVPTLIFFGVLRAAFAQPPPAFALRCPALAPDDHIPASYTCDGVNHSPPLLWTGVPKGAKTLALVVKDPDAPRGTFIHWVLYNLPVSVHGLSENVPADAQVMGMAEQGVNDFGQIGYKGPCPPGGSPHHYHFELLALDSSLALKPGASAAEVEAAAQGHVLATTELVGIFGR